MKDETVKIENGLLTGIATHDTLAFLDKTAYSGGTSSYDRDGGNNDGFFGYNFIRQEENGDYVMCDLKGCGVITRIWLTGSFDQKKNIFKFYVDGDDLTYSITLSELNNEELDNKSAFPYPLIKRWYQSACGTVLLTPIRFNHSCKITTNGITSKTDGSTVLFYHVDYKLFSENFSLKSFQGRPTDTELRDMIRDILPKNLGNDPKDKKATRKFCAKVSVCAGQTVTAFEDNGKGQIQSIVLTLRNFNVAEKGDYTSDHLRARLNGLKILIYWDGADTPAVIAPIGSFFGIGTLGYKSEVRALYFGVNENKLYNYFPMPYEKSAKICFVSDHDEEIVLEVVSKPVNYNFSDVGYFHTEYREFSIPAQDPFEAVFFDKKGRGKVVAIQENIFGEEGADCRFEEGDNRIYIDGSRVPDIIGTGTEDYYNGAGYFLDTQGNPKLGLYTSDFTGYTAYRCEGKKEQCREAISAYRILINDAYEFRRNIRICFEHGGGERSLTGEKTMDTNHTVGYQVLVAYYYRSETAQIVSDSFIVNDLSAVAHEYRVEGTLRTEKKTGAFFGGEDLCIYPYTVSFMGKGASFRMCLPPENEGAVLRRVCDCSVGAQNAKVYVDGQYVGDWYTAQANEKFPLNDPYFLIPSAFTVGKEKVHIRIENTISEEWSAISYELCPLCRGGETDPYLPDGQYIIRFENEWVGMSKDTIVKVCDKKLAHPFRIFSCGRRKRIVCSISGKLLCCVNGNIHLEKFDGNLDDRSAWDIEKVQDGWKIFSVNEKYTFCINRTNAELFYFEPLLQRIDCQY